MDDEETTNIDEIRKIIQDVQRLKKKSGISRWDIAMWTFGIILGALGVILAAPTGGLSLGLSVIGLLLVLADVVKKLRDHAKTPEDKEELDQLSRRIAELTERLQKKRP